MGAYYIIGGFILAAFIGLIPVYLYYRKDKNPEAYKKYLIPEFRYTKEEIEEGFLNETNNKS